eukprot:403345750
MENFDQVNNPANKPTDSSTTAIQDAQGDKLNESEFKVYDRQLRVWGIEAQKKLKDALVLLVNMSSVVTECARHLTLSGINLHLVDKTQQFVEEHDTQSDFLFSHSDIGKLRVQVVAEKLREMNPFVKITFETKLNQSDLLKDGFLCLVQNSSPSHQLQQKSFSAVIQGFSSFQDAETMNNYCRDSTIPFYVLNSSGLNGFFFADLGKSFEFSYRRGQKDAQTDQSEIVQSSLSLQSFLQSFASSEEKIQWNRRQSKNTQKFAFLAFLAQALKEKHLNSTTLTTSTIPVDQTMTTQTLNCPTTDDTTTLLQNLKILLTAKSLPTTLVDSSDFLAIFNQIDRCFNLEFNPSASVIGALVSQEIVKVITQRDFPGWGMFIYDSDSQYCTQELLL